MGITKEGSMWNEIKHNKAELKEIREMITGVSKQITEYMESNLHLETDIKELKKKNWSLYEMIGETQKQIDKLEARIDNLNIALRSN